MSINAVAQIQLHRVLAEVTALPLPHELRNHVCSPIFCVAFVVEPFLASILTLCDEAYSASC